jgi:mono/diheme cytochrome c family protein
MNAVERMARRGFAGLFMVLILLVGWAYGVSEWKLRRTFEVAGATIAIPRDSVAIARGAHLARAVGSCQGCHGEDGGGGEFADMGPIGRIVAPNLTGGRTTPLSDADWVRALRSGVGTNHRSLILMPSEVFVYMSASDLGAVIAYYRSLPPVQRELPRTQMGLLGRALLAAGALDFRVAPKTPDITPPLEIVPGSTVEYGRYLADIAGCHGCHGFGLSGGTVAGPPGTPAASNLTPAALSSWTQVDFDRALRQGKRPNGAAIDSFMPYSVFTHMTDQEVEALWLYLQSVPARAFGSK